MTSPVGPVRSGLVRLGPIGLVRLVRCVYEDTRTGPISRTNQRTDTINRTAPVHPPCVDGFALTGAHL
jgi:hypothetical protein